MKKLIFRESVWGVLGRVVPLNSVKVFASEISTDIKNTGIVSLVVKKNWFLGVHLGWGGTRRGGTLKLRRNICLFYLLISKNKTGALVWGKQKISIYRSILGVQKGYFQRMLKHSSVRYGLILEKRTSARVWDNQNIDLWGVSFEWVPEGGGTPNYVKIIISNISTVDIKKHWHQKLSRSKAWF